MANPAGIKPISRNKIQVLAGMTRDPRLVLICEELENYADAKMVILHGNTKFVPCMRGHFDNRFSGSTTIK